MSPFMSQIVLTKIAEDPEPVREEDMSTEASVGGF